jgi:hypothetical protein
LQVLSEQKFHLRTVQTEKTAESPESGICIDEECRVNCIEDTDQGLLREKCKRDETKPRCGTVTKVIVGLSLHSVLTGLSIGLLGNDSLIPGVLALIPHKVAVLLLLSTMGLEINARSRFVHFMIFSAALPAGILISMGISTIKNVTALCVFEALGCGAIFYVAILEMLPQAINQGGFKMLKYLIVLVGITCIAVLQLSHSHAHGHDHGDHDHGHHEHDHEHEVPNLS